MENLKRRKFLGSVKGVYLAAIIFLVSCESHLMASDTESEKKPNIIFLLTDDQRARTLSIEAHPIIKTPHLDKLAANGIRFTNAFITAPTCMPSRATFFTGVYERVHGIGFSSTNELSEQADLLLQSVDRFKLAV